MRVFTELPHPSEFTSTESQTDLTKYKVPFIQTPPAKTRSEMVHLPHEFIRGERFDPNVILRYFFANQNIEFLQNFIIRVFRQRGQSIVRQDDNALSVIMASAYKNEFQTIRSMSAKTAVTYLNTIVIHQIIPNIEQSLQQKRRRLTNVFKPSALPPPIITSRDRSHEVFGKPNQIRFG